MRKFIVLICSLLLFTAVLAGCGGNNSDNNSAASDKLVMGATPNHTQKFWK